MTILGVRTPKIVNCSLYASILVVMTLNWPASIYIYIYIFIHLFTHIYIYIYPRGPSFSDDRTPFVAPLQMITLYHAPRQGRVGWGVGWGGVYYRSWNVDHVVDAPLQMITLYHARKIKKTTQKTCWLSGFLTFKQHSNVVQIPCKIRLPLFCLWKHRVKWDVSTYVAYHRNVSVLYL